LHGPDGVSEARSTLELVPLRQATLESVGAGRAALARLWTIVLRQAYHETRVRRWRGLRFRSVRPNEVRGAYQAMQPWELEGINARQAWANWRTIPRNLEGRVDGRPLQAIDLCCGTGQSTEVLAYYLPAGSSILGLEYHAHFVEAARGRSYRTRSGVRAHVSFRAQSVLETFRDPSGAPVGDQSVDLVNSSGAVGCHFDRDATATLADEVARVIRPGGLALIDSGRAGTPEREVCALFEARGFRPLHRARSCAFDRYVQVCLRKEPS
jgi:SAM-dependent methyltransferase